MHIHTYVTQTQDSLSLTGNKIRERIFTPTIRTVTVSLRGGCSSLWVALSGGLMQVSCLGPVIRYKLRGRVMTGFTIQHGGGRE